MKEGRKVELTSLDDLFSTQESRDDAQREKVVEIPLSELYQFANHPFKVLDDEKMQETAESVREHGVLVPAIARPRPDGGYELISGHRRHRACQLAGLETMPVIVRNLDNDQATIIMVDSNLQRETLLPSERAFAYKMKMEAMSHQGVRTEITSRQLVGKLETADLVGEAAGESGRQVQRYIRLTELIDELLQMVDNHVIAFNPAVELSYLTKDEQRMLLVAMDSEQATPSLSQAQRLKQLSRDGQLDEDSMLTIMSEEKKVELDKLTFNHKVLHTYFPKHYTPKQMEDTIIALLEEWRRREQQKAKLQQHMKKGPDR